MRARSQASAGMVGVGSWGVDGGDGEKWPKSWALTGREKDRLSDMAMGTGTAVMVMIWAGDVTEQNIRDTHRGQERDRD